MRTPFPQTRLLPLFLLVLLTLTSPSHASKWYEVHFATIPHPEPVQFFFDFSGQMVIPKLVSPGAYYVFPGMQPRYPGGGIYQNVLDGRSGIWNFASGVCCFKGLKWGDGFHVYAGETVTFDNKWDHPGDPHTGWTSTITHDSTGTTRRNSWPIGDRFWNQAVFAIEVYGNAWDFGPLEFRNVVIRSSGQDTSWCKPQTNTAIYAIENLQARATPRGVLCSFDRLILQKSIPGRYPPKEKE
ncbi:hypothetical protein IWX49DRAFT_54525 [Phyllosticta citricarpa]|uniref:Uncharacterized protein n=1 Tax=Phyllosticta paracitricarpa TaxID=2016321 RepID=A0ABR1NA19_9PEZI